MRPDLLTSERALEQAKAFARAELAKTGKMHRWTEADGYISAQLSGPSMQVEVTRHFSLIYLVAVQPDASVELRQQIMRELRATAQLLKEG